MRCGLAGGFLDFWHKTLLWGIQAPSCILGFLFLAGSGLTDPKDTQSNDAGDKQVPKMGVSDFFFGSRAPSLEFFLAGSGLSDPTGQHQAPGQAGGRCQGERGEGAEGLRGCSFRCEGPGGCGGAVGGGHGLHGGAHHGEPTCRRQQRAREGGG